MVNSGEINTFSGSYATISGGFSCTASGVSFSVAKSLEDIDEFLINKSIEWDACIIKYNPLTSEWKIYHKRVLEITKKVYFKNCESETITLEHNNKKIGCIIMKDINIDVLDGNIILSKNIVNI